MVITSTISLENRLLYGGSCDSRSLYTNTDSFAIVDQNENPCLTDNKRRKNSDCDFSSSPPKLQHLEWSLPVNTNASSLTGGNLSDYVTNLQHKLESRLMTNTTNLCIRNESNLQCRFSVESNFKMDTKSNLADSSGTTNLSLIDHSNTAMPLHLLGGVGNTTTRSGQFVNVDSLCVGHSIEEPLPSSSHVIATGEVDVGISEIHLARLELTDELQNLMQDTDIDTPDMSAQCNELIFAKKDLLNIVCSSLIGAPRYTNERDSSRIALIDAANKCLILDPEFILKVALYARDVLNLRTPANFLLAYAADNPPCRPFLRKYFSKTIRLPSDWIEVPTLYATMAQDKKVKNRTALPAALRRAMVSKFGDFDTFQLAKHNKNKKTNKKSQADKKKGSMMMNQRGAGRGKRFVKNAPAPAQSAPAFESAGPLNLKKLIRQLHLEKPAESIMSLVGKRYPDDSVSFARSGLLGVWDSNRAGKRMRLSVPETWETQVASRGNKSEVWQDLLDHKKLPYMAMLRNLRNMIKAGVSTGHHESVLKRLQDEKQVINSRQFPFRFFSAYQALEELRTELAEKVAAAKIAVENPKPPKVAVTPRKGGKLAKKQFRREQNRQKQQDSPCAYNEALLTRYQRALDTAVKVATKNNVKPIPGRTIVVCEVTSNANLPCTSAKGLGKPMMVKQVGLLLSLMCKISCEDCQLYLLGDKVLREVASVSQNETILQTLKKLDEELLPQLVIETDDTDDDERMENGRKRDMLVNSLIEQRCIDRKRFDNFLFVRVGAPDELEDTQFKSLMRRYRREVNPDLLYVDVILSNPQPFAACQSNNGTLEFTSKNDVTVYGFSDAVLRYVAERGDAGQINYVDHIAKIYDLPEVKIDASTIKMDKFLNNIEDQYDKATQLCESESNMSKKSVRIFVSSTFRDMHSEREVLVKFVFPELCRKAERFLNLQLSHIDLRWGLTSEDMYGPNSKGLEMCLNEVQKSDLFFGIIGDRYGYCPSSYNVGDNDTFDWLDDIPTGVSVTELEFECFLRKDAESTKNISMLIRDPINAGGDSTARSEYVSNIIENDIEKQKRLDNLKRHIQSKVTSVSGYDAKLVGIESGKLVLTDLNKFADAALKSIWNMLCDWKKRQISIETDSPLTGPEMRGSHILQWKGIIGCVDSFCGRTKELKTVISMIKKQNTGILNIVGEAGCGKTSFMSAAINDCYTMSLLVIPCFSSYFMEGELTSTKIIDILMLNLVKLFDEFNPSDLKTTGTNSVLKLKEKLDDIFERFYGKLVIFIDGVDIASLAFIQELIHFDKLLFVVSTQSEFSVSAGDGIRKIKPTTFNLPPLHSNDRAELVRNHLDKYGKHLDESAFNNQMRLLLSKRGSEHPNYLSLACDCLCAFGDYDKLTAFIRSFPSAVDGIVKNMVKDLDKEFGQTFLKCVLSVLVVSDHGISDQLWYDVCANLWTFTSSKTVFNSMSDLLEGTASSLPTVSRSSFVALCNALRPVLVANGVVRLATGQIRTVIRKELSINAKSEVKDLFVVGLCLYRSVDPLGDDSFESRNGRAYSQLIDVLMRLKQWSFIGHLLMNLDFLCALCEVDLLHDALTLFEQCKLNLAVVQPRKKILDIDVEMLESYQQFVGQNLTFLKRYPNLFGQCVVNDGELWSDNFRPQSNKFRLMIRDSLQSDYCETTRVSRSLHVEAPLRSYFTVVAISDDSKFVAFGTNKGNLRLTNFTTGETIVNFFGHAASITSVCFLGRKTLCSTASDKSIVVWDCSDGRKLKTMNNQRQGHNESVSACVPNQWQRSGGLITVGWDGVLIMWNYLSGKLLHEIRTASAINCIAVNNASPVFVTGHWDRTVKLFDANTFKRTGILRGHSSAVRSVAVSQDGCFIASAAMDGQIRMWSSLFGGTIGCISGHQFPVTSISFSPDMKYLYTSSEDGSVKIWNANLGKPLLFKMADFAGNDEVTVTSVTLSGDATTFLAGYNSGMIKLIDAKTGIDLFSRRICEDKIVSLNYLPLHSTICFVSSLHKSWFMDVTNVRDVKLIPLDCSHQSSDVTCSSVSQEHACVTHRNGAVCVYNLVLSPWLQQAKGGKGHQQASVCPVTACLFGHEGAVFGCALDETGHRLATVGEDRCLTIWSLIDFNGINDGRQPEFKITDAHKDSICSVAWSDRKPLLVTSSMDGSVQCWTMVTSESKGHNQRTNVEWQRDVTIHTTSAVFGLVVRRGCIAGVCQDGTITLWSYKGMKLTSLKSFGSSDIKPLTCSLLLDVKLGDVPNWAAEVEEDETEDRILDKAMNYESALVVAGFDDGSCMLWTPLQGCEVKLIAAHQGPALGVRAYAGEKDEGCISVGTDCRAYWWRVTNDEPMAAVVTDVIRHDSCVTAILILSDQALISADRTGKMIVWFKNSQSQSIEALSPECTNFDFRLLRAVTALQLVDLVNGNEFKIISSSESGVVRLLRVELKLSGSEPSARLTVLGSLSYDWPLSTVIHCIDTGVVGLWSMKDSTQFYQVVKDGMLKKVDQTTPVLPVLQMLAHGYKLNECKAIDFISMDVRRQDQRKATRWAPLNYLVAVVMEEANGKTGSVSLFSQDTPPSLRKDLICTFQAHNGKVTDIGFLSTSELVTVSDDCSVKLWRFKESKTEVMRPRLIGCWQSDAAFSTVKYLKIKTNDEIWCGDVLGRLFCLNLH